MPLLDDLTAQLADKHIAAIHALNTHTPRIAQAERLAERLAAPHLVHVLRTVQAVAVAEARPDSCGKPRRHGCFSTAGDTHDNDTQRFVRYLAGGAQVRERRFHGLRSAFCVLISRRGILSA